MATWRRPGASAVAIAGTFGAEVEAVATVIVIVWRYSRRVRATPSVHGLAKEKKRPDPPNRKG